MNISVLILAAGSASRMGEVKQLLPYKGITLLEHVINQVNSSKVGNVFCVLGANSEYIQSKIKPNKVVFLKNLKWKEGLSSSIVTGVEHIKELKQNIDAILILLADQPFVDANFINELIETYKNTNSIVASSYGNKNGVPAIFPKATFESLVKLKGDKGAKDILNDSDFKVISVASNIEKTLFDIDSPSDYNTLLNT